MEEFHYDLLPIDSNIPVIRLLTLLSSDSSLGTECELSQFPLLGRPHYEALSYCWGETSKIATIVRREFYPLPKVFTPLSTR